MMRIFAIIFIVLFITGIALPVLLSTDKLPLVVIILILTALIGGMIWMMLYVFQKYSTEDDL